MSGTPFTDEQLAFLEAFTNQLVRAGVGTGNAQTAQRAGRKLWPATVTAYGIDPALQEPVASVVIDGDPEPKQPHQARVFVPFPLAVGDRVMVEFDPPLGIFVTMSPGRMPLGQISRRCSGGGG